MALQDGPPAAPLSEMVQNTHQSIDLEEEDVRFADWARGSDRSTSFGGHGCILAALPEPNSYAALLAEAAEAVVAIKRRVQGLGRQHKEDIDVEALWCRLFKSGRMFKEMTESLPMVARFLSWLEALGSEGDNDGKEPVTVVELCSGIGYMSMLLSEIVRAREEEALAGTTARRRSSLRSIARFVLIDNAFPMQGMEAKAQHINPQHLLAPNLFAHDLSFRKYDLKSSSGHRQLAEHVLNNQPGCVALLGFHLCGVLAINAVRLYNDHPRACFLALKPCCLPPISLVREEKRWYVGGHCICAEDVCGLGVAGADRKGRWENQTGISKKKQSHHFERWVHELFLCLECQDNVSAAKKDILDIPLVADENYYQTKFIFATRKYRPENGSVSSLSAERPSDGAGFAPAEVLPGNTKEQRVETAHCEGEGFPLDPEKDAHGLGAGDSFLLSHFLTESDADAAFHSFLPDELGGAGEISWVQMYGPDGRLLPRLQNVMAEGECYGLPIYRYPQNNQHACGTEPWSETAGHLRDAAATKACGHSLNHCVGNLYRNEREFIGPHRDKMLDILEGSLICTLSLGAERPMILECNGLQQVVPLRHGSLFVIGPKTNRLWSHALPPQKQPLGPRISLTIRQMGSFLDLHENSIVGQGSKHQDKNWPSWEHDLTILAKVLYPRQVPLLRELQAKHREGGSTFECRIMRCTTLANVDELRREIEEQFPDACRVPYAWIIRQQGSQPALQGAENHGEPRDTARNGILGPLRASGLTDCAAFIVRHWDGVHLGLRRVKSAYKSATLLALEKLKATSVPPANSLE